MSTEISLKQSPIIQYKQEVLSIGKSIDERLEKLDLKNQVATIDTLKFQKELRADFNKELKEYESQRTLIKKEILKEYDEFELLYKTEVKGKIEKAVETLKDNIAFVEDGLRKKKEDGIKDYFNELCLVKSIDFLTFDKTDINITLSVADKQYKEKCIEFVNKIADDLELINTQANKAEILVEYKTSLNAARSIKVVQERKTVIEAAEQQLFQDQINKRTRIIMGLGFVFNENTARYERGNDFISYEIVENLSTEDFKQWAETKISQEISVPEQPVVPVSDDVVFMDAPVFSIPLMQTVNYSITGTKTQIDNLDKFLKEYQIRNTKS